VRLVSHVLFSTTSHTPPSAPMERSSSWRWTRTPTKHASDRRVCRLAYSVGLCTSTARAFLGTDAGGRARHCYIVKRCGRVVIPTTITLAWASRNDVGSGHGATDCASRLNQLAAIRREILIFFFLFLFFFFFFFFFRENILFFSSLVSGNRSARPKN
jgi:hypothetical protein